MEQFITYQPKNVVVDFNGTDTLDLFTRNRKKLGKDWIYENKKIQYRFNEQGFRNDPFHDIDWKNSIVVLGCSYVQGIGLAEEDMLVHRLKKLMGRPVVNLGVGGAGVDVACWNGTILHDFYPNPKAVVQIWSGLNRYADYRHGEIDCFVPQHDQFQHRLNWKYRSKFYIKTDRAVWRNKTTYSEASFFLDTAEELDVMHLPHLDYARDMLHTGIQSNIAAAEHIAEDLRKKGL